ncbi:MAG: RHS repeat-associated core domain-containing protein [Phycisphaerales bacterium]
MVNSHSVFRAWFLLLVGIIAVACSWRPLAAQCLHTACVACDAPLCCLRDDPCGECSCDIMVAICLDPGSGCIEAFNDLIDLGMAGVQSEVDCGVNPAYTSVIEVAAAAHEVITAAGCSVPCEELIWAVAGKVAQYSDPEPTWGDIYSAFGCGPMRHPLYPTGGPPGYGDPSGCGGGGAGPGGLDSVCMGVNCDGPLVPEIDPSTIDHTPPPTYYSSWPVELESGVKIESMTDLVVDLPGSDFVLSRNYRSDRFANDLSEPGIFGNGWMSNVYSVVVPESASTIVLVLAGQEVAFSNGGSGTTFSPPGNDKRRIEKTTVGGGSLAIWRLISPGRYEIDFYRAAGGGETEETLLIGLPKETRDVYGARWAYEWVDTFTDITGMIDIPRLDRVRCYVPGSSGETEIARVDFSYETDDDEFNYGRVTSVEEQRYVDSSWTALRRVSYRYKDLVDGISPDVGGPGDLVEVVHSVIVDQDTPGGSPVWYDRYTHYRYHVTLHESASSRIIAGTSGSLKMVIPAEQIEYHAQRVLSGDVVMSSPGTTIAQVSARLLELDDDYEFMSAISSLYDLVDLPSKIVANYVGGKVTRQYILSGCGCSGSTQGIRLDYDYFTHASGDYKQTTKIAQSRLSTTPGVYQNHVIHYHELVQPVAGTRLVEGIRAIVANNGSDSRKWVTNWTFDGDGNVLQVRMPSNLETYTPGTVSSTPDYTADDDGGLVYHHSYNGTKRRTKIGVSEGTTGTIAWTNEFVYGDSMVTGERDWLVKESRAFRDPVDQSPSTYPNLVEVKQFTYGFRSGKPDAFEYVTVSEEAELESENGPGGTYQTSYFYDEWSRLSIVAHADKTLTYSVFQPSTSQVVKRYDHWDKDLDALDGGGTWTPPITLTGWGGRTGAGTKVVEFGRDALGRVTSVTRPGAITTHTVRELRTNDQRPSLKYLAMVFLPHKLAGTSTFDGPASITWINAGGASIRSSDYLVTAIDAGDYTDYTLGDETARRTSINEVSGLVTAQREWHRLGGSAAYYETEIEYDTLGRVEAVTNDNGTVTERRYDVLGRVVEVLLGTTSQAPVTVQRLFYDFTGTSSPTQGTGDGNLTWVRQLPDGTGGNDRNTRYIHDFRNRRVGVQMAIQPHMIIEHDNLDRPVRQLVFKGSFPGTPTIASVTNTDRGRWTETAYSQRGLAYKQAVAIDPANSGAPTMFLESHTWFDEMGRPVGSFQPSSPMTKITYDAFGRREAVYSTDRADDAQPGTSGNYADVYTAATWEADISGDHVLAQAEYDYVAWDASLAAGQMSLQTTRNRLHDYWGMSTDGALDTSNSISTYRGYFYDDANRILRVADYGTNASGFVMTSTAPTINQASPPDADPGVNVLVAGVAYDAIGRVSLQSSPRTYNNGMADVPYLTKSLYDALDREIAVIENFDDAVVAWDNTDGRYEVTSGLTAAEPDTDRVTSFVFDGSGNIVKRIAHLPDGTSEAVQITQYDYGYSGTLISSNDLLAFVAYPDESTGLPGTTSAYKVTYDYNRLGEATLITDQNGTMHAYTRDTLGRVESNSASPGTGISSWADSLEYEYDDFGRLEVVSTKSSSTVLNQLTYAYDDLWQLESFAQDPAGAVNLMSSDTSAEVLYDYAIAEFDPMASAGHTHNQSRFSLLEYPDSSGITNGFTHRLKHRPDYGAATNDTDDRIARMTGSSWAIGGTSFNHTVAHELLGTGMPVASAYATPGLKLDRFADPADGTTTSGEYPGLDRFGRLTRHVWSDDGWDPADTPSIFDLEYEYDHNSNITTRSDRRVGVSLQGRDEQYTYDGLDRLTEALRGEDGGSFGSPELLSQAWDLDMLGNWGSFQSESNGSAGFVTAETFDRDHDMANQITSDTFGTGSAVLGFTYDDAGNMTTQPTGLNSRRLFTWDAWNRLVKVEVQDRPSVSDPWNSARIRAVYTYYGMHQRATAIADADLDVDAKADRAEHFYYDAGWRLLERRRDTFTNAVFGSEPSFALDEPDQFVWGQRYIDELMFHRRANAAGQYAVTDRNFSVIAMAEDSETITHRTRYTAYGHARTAPRGDANADGTVNSDDLTILLSAFSGDLDGTPSGYVVEADFNLSGVVDSDDLSTYTGAASTSVPTGDVSTTDTPVGYAGYIFDDATGLYCVRFRWFAPEMGRWLSRDPAGYVDGANLSLYAGSNPKTSTDPSGLKLTFEMPSLGHPKLSDPLKLRIEEAIQNLCPTASFKRNKGTGFLADELIFCEDVSEHPANTPEVCIDPPGCKVLKRLRDSKRTYQFNFGNSREYVDTGGDPDKNREGERPVFFIPGNAVPRNSHPRIVTPLHYKPKGNYEFWEWFWHEIIHAYHFDYGFYPYHNKFTIRDDGGGSVEEEILTIFEMNRLRDWYNTCRRPSEKPPVRHRAWDHPYIRYPGNDDTLDPIPVDELTNPFPWTNNPIILPDGTEYDIIGN